MCSSYRAAHPFRLFLIGVMLLTSPNLAAAQGRRVALVVGNGSYRAVTQLTNPANDARLIARTLESLGFQLIGGGARLDLDKREFDSAVRAFGQALPGAEVALFYYAGHGMQVQGTNWLVPLDANPSRVQDMDFQMVDASLVLRQMEGAGTRLNVMILDACRNNPFGGRGLRGGASGLAQMRAPEGTLISYATQPGNTAADGTGLNSPYTQALADAMRQPGLDVLRMFNRVGVTVKKATGGDQQPWVSSSPIDGDYYFAGAGSAPNIATAAVNPVPPPFTPPSAPPSIPPSSPRLSTPPDPAKAIVGRWRFASDAGCSDRRAGIVGVADGHVRFEWRRGSGPPNIAVERIDKIAENVIFTTVVSDVNTRTPEVGHRMRYTVEANSWTSENLTTGKSSTHRRCP